MPGGLAFDSAQSYVAFAAIKFVGYSIAGLYLSSKHPTAGTNPLLFGLARTILGMLFGAVLGFIGLWTFELALIFFLVFLIPFRFLEWWIVLKIFFSRAFEQKYQMSNYTAVGVVWSFALDIPAILGFIATGGFWIC